MPRDSTIQTLFAKNWQSAQAEALDDSGSARRKTLLYSLGRIIGHRYTYFLAKQIARDKNLAISMQEQIRRHREAEVPGAGKNNRCAIRLCSTQRLGKFVMRLPSEFVAGLQDRISERIRTFFPQKGEAPHDGLTFNYFVSNVIFENSDYYGAFFRQQEWQVEVLFQIELPDDRAA